MLTPSTGESLTVAPSKTTELPIYTISGDLTELTAVTALVSEETITEQIVTDAVVEALETLHGSMTMLVIAHRQSTIEHCEQIIKVGGGNFKKN